MANSSSQVQPPKAKNLSFENTEIAFKGMSQTDLNRAYWLFKMISSNFLTKIGPPITNFALRIGLPIQPIIKATIFRHFCGGETIEECEQTIENLSKGSVGSILDYSVEGAEEEDVFDETCREILNTIQRATGDSRIPLTVFKVTGIGRFGLLEKISAKYALSADEETEFNRLKNRAAQICQSAFKANVPVMIDAEESWIQQPIDDLAMEMMRKYNRESPIVLNTYQLYRHDKLQDLKADAAKAKAENFILGAKLVRGAYMEKERKRAADMGYISPINSSKEATDKDYNEAVLFCINNIDQIGFVAGTHNENSCRLLTDLLNEKEISSNHPHVYFSQLLGMSDNLSFNLSNAGYNVAKYVPYGPVKAVLPYLFRRAQENTSIAGQMGRELNLIIKEQKRRRKN
ncbi:proline dehydrogenase family protein [Daejeonella oryzae]|uniref:proline dehydrogenase family protein n=1 Tax=Daejeonella oryzae TaxID=1122943 RepID=UPI0003F887E7|nr:proline dehydrogenase family protein [Daejeonella oryzae]